MSRVKNLDKFCQTLCSRFSSSQKNCANYPQLDMLNFDISVPDQLFSSNKKCPFYPQLTHITPLTLNSMNK